MQICRSGIRVSARRPRIRAGGEVTFPGPRCAGCAAVIATGGSESKPAVFERRVCHELVAGRRHRSLKSRRNAESRPSVTRRTSPIAMPTLRARRAAPRSFNPRRARRKVDKPRLPGALARLPGARTPRGGVSADRGRSAAQDMASGRSLIASHQSRKLDRGHRREVARPGPACNGAA